MPSIAEKGQTCRVIETFEGADLLANTTQLSQFNLLQFARASNIAPNFKWYRAARVIYTYDPLFNTFQDGTGAANASKPYMYTVMNRTQMSEALYMLKVSQFQTTGARPVPLVTQRKISYKPNWCSPGLLQGRIDSPPGQPITIAYSSNGLQAQYGWLATPILQPAVVNADELAYSQEALPVSVTNPQPPANPANNAAVYTNQVIYNGHYTFIDQKYTGGDPENQPVARVTVTVVWEFKEAQNPLALKNPSVGLPAVAPKTA